MSPVNNSYLTDVTEFYAFYARNPAFALLRSVEAVLDAERFGFWTQVRVMVREEEPDFFLLCFVHNPSGMVLVVRTRRDAQVTEQMVRKAVRELKESIDAVGEALGIFFAAVRPIPVNCHVVELARRRIRI